ncbi:MAG: hypothetical protein OCD03_14440 [Hyphomicrobiales bacterium]
MLQKIISSIPSHATKTALFLAIFACFSTFLTEYLTNHILLTSLLLCGGTILCAFICILILHYFIFRKLHKNSWKVVFLLAFPIFYFLTLITAFATVTTLADLTWFRVPLINQIYLQGWALLGKGYIYAVFSPKTPFYLTCILTLGSFILALKTNNSQQGQD